jgi:ATP-binding protein involved in chromosome partitioning
MTKASAQAVDQALSRVLDPVYERPMLEVGSLKDVAYRDGRVSARVVLSSPSKEQQARAEERLTAALAPLGVELGEVSWEVQVPTRQIVSNDPVPEVRNVILVMSGKGGVGKSTVATNLALALKDAGMRVGLLDADVYGPSIPLMMGISGHPSSDDGKRIRPLERFGVKLMSIGFLLEDPKSAVVWRGPMLHGALSQFLKDVDWGALDHLVIDLPPGTGDVALSIAQNLKVTGAVMVTTPQEVALADVYKGVSMCEKLSIPILGVVENMSYFVDSAGVRTEIFGSGGGQKIAEFAKAPLLGQIPIEPEVGRHGDSGTPIVRARPESGAARALADIAESLATRVALAHFARGGGTQVPAGEAAKRLRIVR